MTLASGKALLHLTGRIRRVVDADDIVRIHRNHVVHPGPGSGWEVRLEPPVNLVLPVSRRSLTALLKAYRPKGARDRQGSCSGRGGSSGYASRTEAPVTSRGLSRS